MKNGAEPAFGKINSHFFAEVQDTYRKKKKISERTAASIRSELYELR